MKKILLSLALVICIDLANSQTLQELSDLRIVGNIDQADKFLTPFGFEYKKSVNTEQDNKIFSITTFVREGDYSKAAVITFSKEKVDEYRLFRVQYVTHSIKVFDDLKSQCELIQNCVLKNEKVENDGAYRRYFSDGTRTFIFTISQPSENGELPMYMVLII